MSEAKFAPLFRRLKEVMVPLEPYLTLLKDEPGNYSLQSHALGPHGRPIWFGGVQINKRYVSYHLMPVYVHPELLKDMSVGLKKRMQGKSCFNFTKEDEVLFAELEQLTRRGFERFEKRAISDA